jgi:hypothetical protein
MVKGMEHRLKGRDLQIPPGRKVAADDEGVPAIDRGPGERGIVDGRSSSGGPAPVYSGFQSGGRSRILLNPEG